MEGRTEVKSGIWGEVAVCRGVPIVLQAVGCRWRWWPHGASHRVAENQLVASRELPGQR